MYVIDRQRELFQQDNARPHTARVAMDYLEQNNINVLPWPFKHAATGMANNTKKQCEKFDESMTRRCRVVLSARGGHTRY